MLGTHFSLHCMGREFFKLFYYCCCVLFLLSFYLMYLHFLLFTIEHALNSLSLTSQINLLINLKSKKLFKFLVSVLSFSRKFILQFSAQALWKKLFLCRLLLWLRCQCHFLKQCLFARLHLCILQPA